VYKNIRAVDDLSFVVEPGRVTGFPRPNGAGKTTTLRMVLNLVAPTAGTATIGGPPLRRPDRADPTGRRHPGGQSTAHCRRGTTATAPPRAVALALNVAAARTVKVRAAKHSLAGLMRSAASPSWAVEPAIATGSLDRS